MTDAEETICSLSEGGSDAIYSEAKDKGIGDTRVMVIVSALGSVGIASRGDADLEWLVGQLREGLMVLERVLADQRKEAAN